MASVLDLVKHYQHAIEKYPNDEQKVLKAIEKLFNLGVTVQHLQDTGVGRTVNSLRKEPGAVGPAARALVYKWKVMVAAEESDHEPATPNTANYNGHGNGKDSDDSANQPRSRLDGTSHERFSKTEQSKSQVNGNSSGAKRKYHSSEEEDNSNKKAKQLSSNVSDHYHRLSVNVKKETSESDQDHSDDSHSSESESDLSESSEEEVRDYPKIKEEPVENHKSSSSKYLSHNHEDHKKETSLSRKSKDADKHSRSNNSESRHSSDKSSSRERSQSSHKHKSSGDKESSSDKKHKYHHNSDDKGKKGTKSLSKDESSSDKHNSSGKHSSSSDKHSSSSSDRHKSSSQKDKAEKSTKSDKHESKSEKHSDTPHKLDKEKHKSTSEKETHRHKSKESSSSSKEKHSSSSKEKSKDRSKDRSNSTKEKSSDSKEMKEKKSSSHENKSKSSSSSKDKTSKSDDKSNEKKSKDKSSSSSHKSSKSSSQSKEDVPKKKTLINSPDGNDGIDCGSGASFAEALGMISPAKPKKKSFKDISSPNTFPNDLSPASLLAPTARLAPLPALEISALPEISPNYRPRPPPRPAPFPVDDAMQAVISSKNQRTKVFSGNKVIGKIPTLYELCVHVLQEHIDDLEFTGGVPYEILKPIVDRATPQQLFMLEYHNPYLTEDTDHLWKVFCEKHFRTKKREEMEAWREMYMRCQEEQEDKLKSLTANIKIATEAKKAPIKQTKMAYVDSVVKPPRNIARKQAQHGTAFAAAASPAARVAALAAAPNVLRGGVRAPPAPAAPLLSTKPKKAPLMAKALQFMRGRKR